MSNCSVHSSNLLDDDQIGFDTCDCHRDGKPVRLNQTNTKSNVRKTKLKMSKKSLDLLSKIEKIYYVFERLAFLSTTILILIWFFMWLSNGNIKFEKRNDIVCKDVKVIPLDLIAANESIYYIYLCNKTNIGKYNSILLVNEKIYKIIKSWVNPEKIRYFSIYCIESQAYCKRMLNIPVETNITSQDCYYAYNYVDITLCLDKTEKLMFGLINNMYTLTVRELLKFSEIMQYWF
jgi:hypothetical protein